MIKLRVALDQQDQVEVPTLGEGTHAIAGDIERVIQIEALLPSIWVATDLLRSISELVGNYAEAQESATQLQK